MTVRHLGGYFRHLQKRGARFHSAEGRFDYGQSGLESGSAQDVAGNGQTARGLALLAGRTNESLPTLWVSDDNPGGGF